MNALAPSSPNSVSDFANRVLVCTSVSWADVEDTGPGAYNEAFLAALRRDLKARETDSNGEEKGVFIEPMFTVPLWAVALSRSEQERHFTATCVHTARRIKDCTVIRGFRLAAFDASLAAAIKASLQPKHPAYEYW